MKLAAHQLQYLPGLRFFDKMRDCDLFVYLDDVQYERREFQNRNRIRTKEGWQYLTLPVLVKGKFTQKISEVSLNTDSDWRQEHLRAIQTNYAKAPYFKEYFPALQKIYEKKYSKLSEIALETILFMKEAFAIKTPVRFSSEFKLKSVSSLRLAELCEAAGAGEYYSGAGAKDYLDEQLFSERKIRISWQSFTVTPYPQVYPGFEPNLSALDLLLNCGPASLRQK